MSLPAAVRVPAWSPLRWHIKNHDRSVYSGDCWMCQRARALCRSKLRFPTREGVDAAVKALNEGTCYERPMVRYPCRWCLAWHMKTARRPEELKRAEKARRKWLRGQL
jgi:hypothetical protein